MSAHSHLREWKPSRPVGGNEGSPPAPSLAILQRLDTQRGIESAMITITKNEAARFLLHYHRLAAPRRLGSEADIVRFIKRVGCIQFDPLNTAAKNADLVLQSRCANYREDTLTRLLYDRRDLLDGWDKNMSIWSVDDWPFFARKRAFFRERYRARDAQFAPVRRLIDDALRRDG
ncbi:MAG: winged helix DNA-binding domain-containing protein, partial [Spirochaetales bacterium]|nr:winged helix DNA-binding domain-containing protein [Spirochaetales bacterium]